MEIKNIYQRINAVMKAVKYVQKDATVQNYKAVSHDQLIAVCRQHLVDNGIVIYPNIVGDSGTSPVIAKGGEVSSMIRYQARYEVNFVNIDKPDDRIIVTVEAQANDAGDKAPGKSITYATKAAILKILSLETGIEDESRATGIDTAEDRIALENCTTLDELKAVYPPIHRKYRGNKVALAEIVATKDAAKARIEKAAA